MSELGDKVKASLERIKAFQPKNGEGYYLAFSGGKDSVVCKHLLEMAGVKYDAHYNNTGIDPPELVRFIIEKHPDVIRQFQTYPEYYKNPALSGKRITMFNLIPEKLMPPTRTVRYCCSELKEAGGDGRKVITGVRWAESNNRKNNQGAVTVFNKKVAQELSDDSNFYRTDRGGWF